MVNLLGSDSKSHYISSNYHPLRRKGIGFPNSVGSKGSVGSSAFHSSVLVVNKYFFRENHACSRLPEMLCCPAQSWHLQYVLSCRSLQQQ